MFASAVVLLLQVAPPLNLSLSSRNAAADAVVEYGLALGIDAREEDADGRHPDPADAESYKRAAVTRWLSARIEEESDDSNEPPSSLRMYLDEHRDTLASLVVALQKESPKWEEAPEGPNAGDRWLVEMRLERVLLAAALVEDHDGNSIDAGRALDAAWSLGNASAEEATVMAQMISTACTKLQAGVLRKIREVPLQWQARLSGPGPWERMIEALSNESDWKDTGGLDSPDAILPRLTRATTDAMKRTSPCGLAAMSDDEAWRPAAEETASETSEEKRAMRDFYRETLFPNFLSALRRAGRTQVDRELTLKVLQLRFEKDAARDGAWPERLADPTSVVCPLASYAYRSDRSGIELRFDGTINPPTAIPIVPLVFRSRRLEPSPTPTASPNPTPTPTP